MLSFARNLALSEKICELAVVIYGETEHRPVYSTSDTISGLAVDPRVHAAIHRERFPVS